MNLPNKLTMMRVIMVPFFMVFAAMSHMGTPQFNATYALIAGILFAVASFTDFLDGYLARKNHLVTDFEDVLERRNVVILPHGVDTVIHGDIADAVAGKEVLNECAGLQIISAQPR